ncbi:hypothetical protein [Lampropedia puyangensis]|uniref:hypothetical protein n=1 Tax=Lampropedia puyangensis TaxID=1330072 RepID=UPI001305123F|nr:hypothetical protein [Lampropedia puyangensis]
MVIVSLSVVVVGAVAPIQPSACLAIASHMHGAACVACPMRRIGSRLFKPRTSEAEFSLASTTTMASAAL